MHPITMHAIPNCDTVKKARTWLDAQGIAYQFHDFKKLGAPLPTLQAASASIGWQALVNKQGLTWKKLDAAVQARVVDLASALDLLQANTSAIKRPLMRWEDGSFTVGFDASVFAEKIQMRK